MGSGRSPRDSSHRSRHDDEDDRIRERRSRKHRRDYSDDEKDSRDVSKERRRHRRSRSPESRSHRRSRSREHRRDKDRHHRRRRSRDDDDRRGERKSHRGGRDRDDERHGDDKQLVKRGGPLPSQQDSFALTTLKDGEEPPKPKEKPNFGTSGVLAAASNSVVQADGSTIVLKYHEPAEARKPPEKDDWKLFVFKGPDVLDTVPLSRRSCWLVGRDNAVVDMMAEHPSVSKQHAALQFRYLEKRNEYGDKIGRVKPYLLDLESANGTLLNGKKIPGSRYLELRDKDLIQFGESTREYVLMLAPRT